MASPERHRLDASDLRRWDQEWEHVEPQWTRW